MPAATARIAVRSVLGRAVIPALLLVVVLLAPARASATQVSCAPFSLTQTYRGWGPALSYGRAVDVRYQGTRCARTVGDTVHLTILGTATVSAAGGRHLDTRAFEVSGTWVDPANPAGWPPPWWGCRVGALDYTWRIPGTYTFSVSADRGQWALDVESTGVQDRSVRWTHDACG